MTLRGAGVAAASTAAVAALQHRSKALELELVDVGLVVPLDTR